MYFVHHEIRNGGDFGDLTVDGDSNALGKYIIVGANEGRNLAQFIKLQIIGR